MATKQETEKSTETAPTAHAPKRVLYLASGSHEADVKSFEYATSCVLDAMDAIVVMHYVKGAVATMYGPGRLAGSYGADEDSVRARVGCTLVPVSTDDDSESREIVEWLPEYIRANLLERKLSKKKGPVSVVQIDGLSGKGSVEEALAAIVDGEFSSSHESYKNDEWISIEPPNLIIMGCRGHGLVRRALLGSVTQNVLNRISVPTLFFRSNLPKLVGSSELVKQSLGGIDQRVVAIAMSGSNSSRRLVEYFVQEHLRMSDVVLLLHCHDETQLKNKDITPGDVEENICRSMSTVSSFLHEETNKMGGRVMRMTLNKDTGSASDIRDRTIDFLGQTDVNLLVVGRALSSAHRLRTVFMTPFPQYCVTHAPCPVLVYNPPQEYARSQPSHASAAEATTSMAA